jgi:hypothetical protein
MKKYLINGAMALIVGGFIVSCSHDDISQPATVDQMTKSFDEMFTELYGPIAPNHNWGFATVGVSEEANDLTEDPMLTRAMTRTADPGNGGVYFGPEQGQTYKDLGIVMPDMVSADEEKFVSDWFKANKNPESDPINLSNFFVLQVYFGNYEYKSTNSGHTSIGGQHMDELCAGSSTIGNDIINNYNANSPARYWTDGTINYRDFQGKIMLMLNSSTERFGYKESQNTENKYYYNFVIKALKYNDKWGYYVGFDYENHGQNGNFPADGFYDDRIIKIVPGNGIMPWTPTENPNAYPETTSIQKKIHKKIIDQGRVFCEDIATAYRQVKEDIDYNDIVFDARVWEIYDQYEVTYNNTVTPSAKTNWRYQYDICLLATGGTIAEKVGIDKKEVDVHDAFGVGQAFMVNTWTPQCTINTENKLSGQWNTPNNIINAVDFSYTITKAEQTDLSNVGISTIPITVKYDGTNGVKALNNRETKDGTDADGKAIKKSSAPYKLCVPLGTPWPIERANIQSAYEDFSDYVSGNQAFWEGKIKQNNLYTSAPPSSIHNDKKAINYTEDVNDGKPTSSTVMVVWGKLVNEQTTLRLYNFNFVAGQTLRFYGNGTIEIIDKNNQELIESFEMVGGSKDITLTASQASLLKESITIRGKGKFSLTKIVALDKF